MGYEILYKRFLVKEDDGSLRPYMIHGSNNCFEVSGKRERSVNDMLKNYPINPNESLREYLGNIYDRIAHENSGFLKGVPKTKKGFVDGFYDKIIPRSEFTNHGVNMEERLEFKFKKTVKRKSDFEISKELENEPLIDTRSPNFSWERYEDKTILPFSQRKDFIIGKGKIKKLRDGKFGFFKSGSRRRYYFPSQIYYIKVVK